MAMTKMRTNLRVLPAMLALLAGSAAFAQGEKATQPQDPDQKAAAAMEEIKQARPVPTWSDAEMKAAAEALAGNWKTTSPIKPSGESGESVEVVMNIAPVVIDGLPNALYAELALAGSANRPYRQAFLQFHRFEGGLRLRTLELRRERGFMGSLVGLWAAPHAMPPIAMEDLVGTLDLAITKGGSSWSGKTPYAYPTATGGATQMTSEMSFGNGKLSVADRGFGADGSQVWGPAKGQSYEFSKAKSPVTVTDMKGDVVVIDFSDKTEGPMANEGDTITCHYVGYLEDGKVFDSSYDRGVPFSYQQGQPLIEGWNLAMADTKKGQVRRLIIPGPMAYGERGRRPVIGPNATLIFDIEVLDVQPAAKPTEQPQPGADGDAAAKEAGGQ